MNTCVFSVFFLFFVVNIFAPNPFLRVPVVNGFELTYNDLIAYLNYSEHLPNNQINLNHLPADNLRDFRQHLYARVDEKRNPEHASVKAILHYSYSIYSENPKEIVDLAIIEIDLKSIWEQLEIIREIVPDSSRSSRSSLHNPEDFLTDTDSDYTSYTTDSTSSDAELRTDTRTLSMASSRAVTPTPEDLIKHAFGLSHASLGSSQSYDQNFF